jgi:hypothetical protein
MGGQGREGDKPLRLLVEEKKIHSLTLMFCRWQGQAFEGCQEGEEGP